MKNISSESNQEEWISYLLEIQRKERKKRFIYIGAIFALVVGLGVSTLLFLSGSINSQFFTSKATAASISLTSNNNSVTSEPTELPIVQIKPYNASNNTAQTNSTVGEDHRDSRQSNSNKKQEQNQRNQESSKDKNDNVKEANNDSPSSESVSEEILAESDDALESSLPDEFENEEEETVEAEENITSSTPDENLVALNAIDAPDLSLGGTSNSLNQVKLPNKVSLATPSKKPTNNSKTFESSNASFPGGQKALYRYIGQNMRYPAEALRDKVSGTVEVKFIVKADGSISSPVITKSLGYGCDNEVLRMLSNMPKWIPAKQGGNKVDVPYQMPVAFNLK